MLKKLSFDERREIAIASDAVRFATDHWIQIARQSIAERSRFAVALSGGSTPNAIYQALSHAALDWSKVWLFWGDERAVPPEHADSNYGAALKNGLSQLPLDPKQIFRMKAEQNLQKHAREYEQLIEKTLGPSLFDLVMLGVGEDGHTASLFPGTDALSSSHLVAANYVPAKHTWRMTLTFPCINQSRHIVLYALGASKQTIVRDVLHSGERYPAGRIGTSARKALWILDESAAQLL